MGFLKKSIHGKGLIEDDEGETASQADNENSNREEQLYMKLYMKIGRDFVHKEDLYRILKELIEYLDIDDFEKILNESESAAEQRAHEYKHFLETEKSGSTYYPDLIDLSKE